MDRSVDISIRGGYHFEVQTIVDGPVVELFNRLVTSQHQRSAISKLPMLEAV